MIKIFYNAFKISQAPVSTQGFMMAGLIPGLTLPFQEQNITEKERQARCQICTETLLFGAMAV